MSLAQRLGWLDGLFTVAILAAAVAVWAPAGDGPAWLVAARVALVGVVCVAVFYYNGRYDFEAPHDVGELFTRLCRAPRSPPSRGGALAAEVARWWGCSRRLRSWPRWPLIKLESRGPVFFVQERVDLHGRPFRLVKFRTMRELAPFDDECGSVTTRAASPASAPYYIKHPVRDREVRSQREAARMRPDKPLLHSGSRRPSRHAHASSWPRKADGTGSGTCLADPESV